MYDLMILQPVFSREILGANLTVVVVFVLVVRLVPVEVGVHAERSITFFERLRVGFFRVRAHMSL